MAAALVILLAVIVALAMYGVLRPHRLAAWVRGVMARGQGLWMAVAVRLLFAVLLWYTAPASHTPAVFKVLAAVLVLTALALPLVGRPRLNRLLASLAAWPSWAIRVPCLLGVASGAFLIWSIAAATGTA